MKPEGAFQETLQYETEALHDFAGDSGMAFVLEELARNMGGNSKRLTLDISGGHSWIITKTILGRVVSFWCSGDLPTDGDRVHIDGICD